MKLALINNNIDLLRIIPSYNGDNIDFKFSLLGNNFKIQYWRLGQKCAEVHLTSEEITYHSSRKEEKKPPVVHIKDKTLDLIYIHSFSNIIDIKSDSTFPVPLCKVTLNKAISQKYTPKNYHVSFDFNNTDNPKYNTVEIFIVYKEYNFEFCYKWPNYDSLWQITTMDYLINGPELSDSFLNTLNSGPKVARLMSTSFNRFNLIFKPYYDKNVQENSISFYENSDFVAFLATTPIQLIDNNTKKPISRIAPAFAFDLEWQLRHGSSRKETDELKRIFDKLLSRVNSLKIHRHVFCIPQC